MKKKATSGSFKKGHFVSEEVRKKISDANKGRTSPNKGKHIIHSGSFKKGHIGYFKGEKLTEEHRKNMSLTTKGIPAPNRTGSKNGFWKGDNVGYIALHDWVKKWRGKPTKCEHCGIENIFDKLGRNLIHWANKSQRYLRDTNDWIALCAKCHKKYDKAMGVKINQW